MEGEVLGAAVGREVSDWEVEGITVEVLVEGGMTTLVVGSSIEGAEKTTKFKSWLRSRNVLFRISNPTEPPPILNQFRF